MKTRVPGFRQAHMIFACGLMMLALAAVDPAAGATPLPGEEFAGPFACDTLPKAAREANQGASRNTLEPATPLPPAT